MISLIILIVYIFIIFAIVAFLLLAHIFDSNKLTQRITDIIKSSVGRIRGGAGSVMALPVLD